MNKRTPMVTSKNSRRWMRPGRLVALVFAILAILTVELSPRVGPPHAPTAEEAEQARNLVRTTRDSLRAGGGTAWIIARENELQSAAALASWLRNFGRFDATVANGQVQLFGSRSFGPFWLNARATVVPSEKGFPAVSITIGKLPLGTTLSRWTINGARAVLKLRGVPVPPLDGVISAVRIDGNVVSAQVHFPLDSGLARQIAGTRATPIDAYLTAKIYCNLVTADQLKPETDLSAIVRRAFKPNDPSRPKTEQHRAAFVALAIYTVGPSAGRLAGDADKRIAVCPTAHSAPLLAGRADLAKHWTLSAALLAALGDDISAAMGEWKELADSRPGGSGFSFVDLSADRAGLAAARAAINPATASATGERLQSAQSDDLLPLKALALSEGMSEAEFVKDYRTIDSAAFVKTKARIDAIIASTIGG